MTVSWVLGFTNTGGNHEAPVRNLPGEVSTIVIIARKACQLGASVSPFILFSPGLILEVKDSGESGGMKWNQNWASELIIQEPAAPNCWINICKSVLNFWYCTINIYIYMIIYIHMIIYIYDYIYMIIYTYDYIYIWLYIYDYIYIWLYIYMIIYIYDYIYIWLYIHDYIYIWLYIYDYIYMCVLPHSVRRYLPSKYRRAGSSASGTVAKRRTVLQRFIVYPALPCKTCTIHPLYNHWIIMITSEHRVFRAPPYRSTLEHTAQISTSSNISR